MMAASDAHLTYPVWWAQLREIKWVFPKMVGFSPKSSILIGFSIIFTIHFGVSLFLETPKSDQFFFFQFSKAFKINIDYDVCWAAGQHKIWREPNRKESENCCHSSNVSKDVHCTNSVFVGHGELF